MTDKDCDLLADVFVALGETLDYWHIFRGHHERKEDNEIIEAMEKDLLRVCGTISKILTRNKAYPQVIKDKLPF